MKKLGPVFNITLGPSFNTKPPNLGPVFNSTACIYIYIYAGEALGCPRFGLQRVNGLAPLKVNRLSTFLGAIFAL